MIGWIPSVLLVLVSLHSIRHASAALPEWVTQDIIDMVHDDKERCMQEHGTTQDLIDKVNDGNIVNERTLTCYMNCLFESFGVVSE
nr:odorant-binding protein 9 [Gregopimpla kuwanae]